MRITRRAFLSRSAIGLAATAAWLEAPALARAADGGGLVPLTTRPPNYEAVRSTFTTRITPLGRFYLRNHFDVPAVDPGAWRLDVRGLVGRPRSFSIRDLQALPRATVEAVLQCAGNGRGLFKPKVPGVQWRFGACGNARWTGARLRDVLELAGVKQGAAHVHARGAERPVMSTTPAFLRGLPLGKALHPDTLLAFEMNGRPLPAYHGAPLRLVVPGWVADDWIKWLTVLEVSADEPKGFFYETAYRFPVSPGPPGAPVPADQTTPMTTLNVKSILASIDDGMVLRAGAHEIVGVAFSGGNGIARVEISVDGGKTWREAALDGPDTPYGFRLFRYAWRPGGPGRHVVASRATDGAGAMQPDVPVWNPSGYLYNAIDAVTVEVRA